MNFYIYYFKESVKIIRKFLILLIYKSDHFIYCSTCYSSKSTKRNIKNHPHITIKPKYSVVLTTINNQSNM